MICKKCGAEFDNKFEFCPMCGSPVKENESEESADADNSFDNIRIEKPESEANSKMCDEIPLPTVDENTTDSIADITEADKPEVKALFRNKKIAIGIAVAIVVLLIIVVTSGNSKSNNYSSDDYSTDSSYETETDEYDSGGIPSGTYYSKGKMTNGVPQSCYDEYISIQGNEAYGTIIGIDFAGTLDYWKSSGDLDVYRITAKNTQGTTIYVAISYHDGVLYRWTEGHVDSENFVAYE